MPWLDVLPLGVDEDFPPEVEIEYKQVEVGISSGLSEVNPERLTYLDHFIGVDFFPTASLRKVSSGMIHSSYL